MDKSIDKKVIKNVKKYLAKVSKDYPIDSAFLFGSFAKGTQHKDSDIDVAIVMKNIENRILTNGSLYGYAWGIDTRIEPHAMQLDKFHHTLWGLKVKHGAAKFARGTVGVAMPHTSQIFRLGSCSESKGHHTSVQQQHLR